MPEKIPAMTANPEEHTEIRHLYANIGKLITSSLELDAILEGIMNEIKLFFNPSNWSLMRLDPNTDELFFVLAEGLNMDEVKSIRLKTGEGIAGMVAKTGKSIFVPDARNDERFSAKVDAQTGFLTKSLIAVPLVFQNRVYGVIELINRDSGVFFTEEEHLIIQTIADFAAIAFANAGLYEKTRLMAFRDPLTGVYNRARLNSMIEEFAEIPEERRTEERDRHILVAIVDLDHFKEINDNYGHLTGDNVLKYMAQELQYAVRGSDRIFRIGGDEFLILIQTSSIDKLKRVTDRLSTVLDKLREKALKKTPAISFSMGIETGRFSEINDIIHRADLAMYNRKKNTKK